MKRQAWKIGLAALVLAAGALGATAYAAHHGNRGEMMRKHVTAVIDDALDAAKATSAQRTAIHAAEDRAFTAFAAMHKGREGQLDEALALFEADKLDGEKIKAFRARHEADAKQVGDAVEKAIRDAHDTLSAAQRKTVGEFIRARHAEMAGHRAGAHERGFRGEMMKHFASVRIDEALDAAKVSSEQRTAIYAARDHLFSVVEESRPHEAIGEGLDKALALFEADRVEPGAVAALRAEQQATMSKLGDAAVQALYDVHDALTAPQRKAVADFVREKHAAWQEHHGRGAGAKAGCPNCELPRE